MTSTSKQPSAACLKAAAHLANNLLRRGNPAARIELLAASCQRAQDHVAALSPANTAPLQVSGGNASMQGFWCLG